MAKIEKVYKEKEKSIRMAWRCEAESVDGRGNL